MRRVPIRIKLAGALLLPLVALVVVTTIEVMATLDQVRAVHDQAGLARTSLGAPSILSKLEDERNAAAVYLLGAEDLVALPVEDRVAAYSATDASLRAFRDDLAGRSEATTDVYRPALEALDGLEDLRRSVDGYAGPRALDSVGIAIDVFDDYSAVMDEMFAANQQVALSISDEGLRRGAELIDLSAQQTDTIARLVRDLLVISLTGDSRLNQPDEIQDVARMLGQLRRGEDGIRAKGAGDYAPLVEDLFASEEVRRFPRLVDEAIASGAVDIGSIFAAAAGDDAQTYGYTVFRHELGDELESQALAIEQAADTHLQRYLVLAVGATLAALLVTWMVSRSITRPLRSLTDQAREMSITRLPTVVYEILETPMGDDVEVPRTEPIAIVTRDEVGDVSGALNTVQDAAVDLAVEQAVLRRNIADSFVNLGRRNQNLLSRQLDFITELESNETDPDTLAALFRLDHLATRMRRNAESLLVLAGIDPPRKWAAPVRLTDVIRAALGEVEDYQRVTIRDIQPATLLGSTAADLAHLIAEFVENALTFSPPEQTVEVHGQRQHDRYTFTIVDNGFGMPPTDITQANRRLAGAESFTIAPSKYLGHYVAGNLAARHGIRLQVAPAPGTGITATIEVPASLLTADADDPGDASGRPQAAKAALDPAPVALSPPTPTPSAPATPAPVDVATAAGVAGTAAATTMPTPGNWYYARPEGDDAPSDTPPDAGAPPAPPRPGPARATESLRTPSGLAKRTPRPPVDAMAQALPDDELVARLSRHTGNGAVGERSRGPAASGGTTSTGLARRVRGAQLPSHPLRAGRREHRDGAAPPDPVDVYGALNSFTAGVQRGLDSTRGSRDGDPPGTR